MILELWFRIPNYQWSIIPKHLQTLWECNYNLELKKNHLPFLTSNLKSCFHFLAVASFSNVHDNLILSGYNVGHKILTCNLMISLGFPEVESRASFSFFFVIPIYIRICILATTSTHHIEELEGKSQHSNRSCAWKLHNRKRWQKTNAKFLTSLLRKSICMSYCAGLNVKCLLPRILLKSFWTARKQWIWLTLCEDIYMKIPWQVYIQT